MTKHQVATNPCAALASLPIQQTHAAGIDVGDASINLVHYAAWLVREMANRD